MLNAYEAQGKVKLLIYKLDKNNPAAGIPFGISLADLKMLLQRTLQELESVQEASNITYYLKMDIEQKL